MGSAEMEEWEEKKARYSNNNYAAYRYQNASPSEIEDASPSQFVEDEGQQQPVRMLLKNKDNLNGMASNNRQKLQNAKSGKNVSMDVKLEQYDKMKEKIF